MNKYSKKNTFAFTILISICPRLRISTNPLHSPKSAKFYISATRSFGCALSVNNKRLLYILIDCYKLEFYLSTGLVSSHNVKASWKVFSFVMKRQSRFQQTGKLQYGSLMIKRQIEVWMVSRISFLLSS